LRSRRFFIAALSASISFFNFGSSLRPRWKSLLAASLIDFKSDRIYNYVWSRDGSQLTCVRGVDVSDAVLISGFK